MYTISMEKQCGCFKRSGMAAQQSFTTKDEALTEAIEMCGEMNETFCKKHSFKVIEEGDNILIRLEMQQ